MANPDRDRHPLVNLVYLVVASALAGLVVAAVAFPAVGATGLAAKGGSDTFEDLPTELLIPPTPQNSSLYAADGTTLITEFYEQNRTDVAISEIPQVMRQAIVAAEDTRFYRHHGVDVRGVLRSLIANNSAGTVRQGASTLTMQYVRNVLFTAASTPAEARAATAQTVDRKLGEMRYALALEKRFSKTEILRRYLNIAAFGHQAYGIHAASERYFSVSPAKLSLPQAALLAGLVKAPDAYDPTQADPRPATRRRNYVLDQMVALHDITAKQAAAAKRSPLGLNPSTVPNGCVDVPSKHRDWGFFCDYFLTWWKSQQQFGDTRRARLNTLDRGGYRIVTTLDPHVQQIAQHQVLHQVSTHNPNAISMAVVQPGTGKVLAMSTNRNYSLDTSHNGPSTARHGQRGNYPNTTNPLISGGGDIYGYQAGSTFKMFTMLAALSAGKPLATSFKAPAKLKTRYPVSGGPASCGGYWCPRNANPSWMDGKRTMWDGFGRSVNTYFAWLEQKVGAEKAVAMAQKLGIRFRAPSDARLAKNAHTWGAFTLGVSAVTPLDLANAYATVAAEGTYCAPRSVLAVTDRNGNPVSVPGADCHRVVSTDVARAATDAARCPVGQQSHYHKCNGGTVPSGYGDAIGRPFAGKTGTTDSTQTATFVGFTPQLAAAAIAADPDNPRNAVGEAYANKVDWAVGETIKRALAGKPARHFGRPSKKIAGHVSGKHHKHHRHRHH